MRLWRTTWHESDAVRAKTKVDKKGLMRHFRSRAQYSIDLKAIEDLHRRDVAATKAYDVDTLVSLWTDDIGALPPGQPPTIGKAAGTAQLRLGVEQSRNFEALEYTQDWKEVEIAGEYAFEWGRFTSAVRPKAGGDIIRQRYNVLRVLKGQRDGSWKVYRTIWNEAPPAPSNP